MRLSHWAFLLILAAVLGPVVAPRYMPEALRPDLFVMLLVFTAARAPRRDALALCWCTGLAKDLLSGGPPGLYAAAYLAAGLWIVRRRGGVGADTAPAVALSAFLVCLATEAVAFAVACARAGVRPDAATVWTLILISLVTGLLMPVCAWAVGRVARWMGVRPRYGFGRD